MHGVASNNRCLTRIYDQSTARFATSRQTATAAAPSAADSSPGSDVLANRPPESTTTPATGRAADCDSVHRKPRPSSALTRSGLSSFLFCTPRWFLTHPPSASCVRGTSCMGRSGTQRAPPMGATASAFGWTCRRAMRGCAGAASHTLGCSGFDGASWGLGVRVRWVCGARVAPGAFDLKRNGRYK